MKISDFWCDLTDISAKKEALRLLCSCTFTLTCCDGEQNVYFWDSWGVFA